MKIWFDMDGTIADLYGVDDWLTLLRSENPMPYEKAKPLVPMKSLAKLLNALSKRGHEIGIISWLSKDSSDEYERATSFSKYYWLRSHLPSVNFHHILLVPYGTDKVDATGGGILFDDNAAIREEWNDGQGNVAFAPQDMFEVLRELL